MLRKFAGCLLVFGAWVSSPVWGLGLGSIELESALNQPMKAKIQLVAASPEEIADLEVRLASADAFTSYGLDRPSYLFDLRFRLVREGTGFVISVTSVQPIKEPFVTMLVEAVWPRGRQLREYTVFLDPPVFVEQTETPAPVATPSTGSRTTDRSGSFQRTPSTTTTTPAPATRTAPRATGDNYRVQRSETLWAIADRFRPTDVTVNQMMIALYKNNPGAFDGNINYLKAGATLAIPSREDALALAGQDATTQVRAQNQRWREGRPSSSTAAVDNGARLELVPPEDGASTLGTGSQDGERVSELEQEVEDLKAQLEAAKAENERLINLRDEELASVQEALTEPQTEAQTELPAEEAPIEAEEPVAETETETTPVAETEGAPTETPTEPEVETTPPPVVASTPEPSLVTKVIDFVKGIWLWLLLGVIGVALAVVFMLRRNSADSDESWDTGEWDEQSTVAPEDYEPTESQPAPAFEKEESFVVVESEESTAAPDEEFTVDERLFEDTGTFTPGELEIEKAEQSKAADTGETAEYPFEDTMIGHDALQLDESDPLAEADFHMAYGLYDQAADLVSAASEQAPERMDLKVKLLEIFFVWGNKDKFLEGARALQQSLGPDAGGEWDKIVIMGKQLCPDEAMFSGDFSGGGDVDLTLDEGGTAEVDLLTGEEGGTDIIELDLDEALSATPVVGGDVPSDAVTRESSVDELRADLEGLQKETTLDMGDAVLDLDLGLDDGGAAAEDPTESTDIAEAPPAQDLGASDVVDIDFDLKTEDTKETAVLEEPAAGATDETVLADLEGLEELRQAVDGPSEDHSEGLVDIDAGDTARLGDIPIEDVAEDEAATVQTPSLAMSEESGGTVETLTLHSPPEGDDDFLDESATVQAPVIGSDDATVQAPVLGSDDATMQAPALNVDEDGTFEAVGIESFDVFSDETGELKGTDFEVSEDTVNTESTVSDFDVFAESDDTVEASVDFSLDDEVTTEAEMPVDLGDPTEQIPAASDDIDEVGTKLDLARAFMDMGDSDGARSILEEVMDEGDSSQKQEAQSLLDSLA